MSEAIGWARVEPPGAHSLRRGAWYAVVDDTASTEVVLDITQRQVVIPRHHLRIRRHRPQCFSVVVRTVSDPNPVRGKPEDLGTTYAVCPMSSSRLRLPGHPEQLQCPECGHRFKVAWDDMC